MKSGESLLLKWLENNVENISQDHPLSKRIKTRHGDLEKTLKFYLNISIGEERVEWYNIKYWFDRFRLTDYEELLNNYKHEISYYPEVR